MSEAMRFGLMCWMVFHTPYGIGSGPEAVVFEHLASTAKTFFMEVDGVQRYLATWAGDSQGEEVIDGGRVNFSQGSGIGE